MIVFWYYTNSVVGITIHRLDSFVTLMDSDEGDPLSPLLFVVIMKALRGRQIPNYDICNVFSYDVGNVDGLVCILSCRVSSVFLISQNIIYQKNSSKRLYIHKKNAKCLKHTKETQKNPKQPKNKTQYKKCTKEPKIKTRNNPKQAKYQNNTQLKQP